MLTERIVSDMFEMNATTVRKEWSTVVDSVVREKPIMFKRTRDRMFLTNVEFLSELLEAYIFHATVFKENDNSFTISLDEIDLIENGKDEQDAKQKLAASILEYAKDYYDDYTYWSRGNRKSHIPYVFKALILGDAEKIGGLIQCRHGGI